jgi:hypothetical protein
MVNPKRRGIQKDGKIVSKGSQLFNIPLNDEGQCPVLE